MGQFPLLISLVTSVIYGGVQKSIDYLEPAFVEYVSGDGISQSSVSFHPQIDGFTRVYSFETPRLKDGPVIGGGKIGYFYYDLDLYTTPFTENSMLVIVHTKTSAASGYVANVALADGYNDRFDLTKLTVKVEIPRIMDTSNGSHTGSVKKIAYWPLKEESSQLGTHNTTSSFGFTAQFNSQITGGANLNGPYIQSTVGPSFSLTFGSSSTITTQDPEFSSQAIPNSSTDLNAFSYFADYAKYGRYTYTMNTYSLYEVGYNVANFNKNGFVVRYCIDMEVGENLLAYLDHYEHITYNYELRWNLGYNPSTVDYFA